MSHILTLTSPDGKTRLEVSLINPGETFPLFGGRSSGLTARKTGSLITRWVHPYGLKDTEHHIHDPSVWKWVDELINWHGFTLRAAQQAEDQSQRPVGQEGK
jgi:hypothetical protein